MLKESRTNEEFEYLKLSPEEQKARGILGRLTGIAADFIHPTRNGRKYSEKLWENVFNDPIMKEKIANRCCFGELGHPTDRTETDMEKIAICLAEQPVKGKDGKLHAIFDILNTPNGRILKSLCDYGCNIGISSRGEGDLITDYEGNEAVDPETYSCECWDAVLIPAVKEARMTYVTESLDKKKYNKTLRAKLQESLDAASEEDRKIMEETLNTLNIKLDEEITLDQIINEELLDEMAVNYTTKIEAYNTNTGGTVEFSSRYGWNKEKGRQASLEFLKKHPNEPWELWYRVYMDGGVLYGEQRFARNTTEEDMDDFEKHKNRKLRIYVNGKSIPKNTPKETIQQYKNKGISVITGFTNVDFSDALQEAVEDEISKDELDKTYSEFKDLVDNKNVEPEVAFEKVTESKHGIQDENLNINEATDNAVDNNEVLAEELQKQIKAKAELEQTIFKLRENLSVCYTKELKTNEELEKYKNSISKLAEDSKQLKALQAKASLLEEKLQDAQKNELRLKEQLKEFKEKFAGDLTKTSSLRENLSNKASEIVKLNESVNNLNVALTESKNQYTETKTKLVESIKQNKQLIAENAQLKETAENEKAALNESIAELKKDMNLQKAENSQKIERSKKLVEKYKKAAAIAVDKYIEKQAIRLGSSVNEIKNRLPESYTFDDIDQICEDVQNYNLTMSKLPISTLSKKVVNENLRVKGTSSKNESILPVNKFDDDVDDDLMYLAGQ